MSELTKLKFITAKVESKDGMHNSSVLRTWSDQFTLNENNYNIAMCATYTIRVISLGDSWSFTFVLLVANAFWLLFV